MTQVRFKRFATKYLLPQLPGWTLGKSALIRRHDEALLLLIHFDSSAFDKDSWSHILAVVFPLYLGYDHLVLNISLDLHRPGRRTWRLLPGDEDDEREVSEQLPSVIRLEGWPFLRERATLERLTERLPILAPDEPFLSEMNLETLIGAELLLGRESRATDYIHAMADFLRFAEDADGRSYQSERSRWEDFGRLIRADPGAARAQLHSRIPVAAASLGAPPVTPLLD